MTFVLNKCASENHLTDLRFACHVNFKCAHAYALNSYVLPESVSTTITIWLIS
jgi:hypothetical protein